MKKIYHYKIVYPVVGGWLADLLEEKKWLAGFIKNVDYILPETKQLPLKLQKYNIKEIEVMPVFSLRTPIDHIEEVPDAEPYVFATFSRVTPEKGIDEAITAICNVNKKYGRIVARLEICGPMPEEYKEHYNAVIENNTGTIIYKGVLPDKDVISTLSSYYMLLFPTSYVGEGFPATLCEAYMAGLPVIASDWKYNSELVENGITGFLFPVHDIGQMEKIIDHAINSPKEIYQMSEAALRKSEQYHPQSVTKNMVVWIGNARRSRMDL